MKKTTLNLLSKIKTYITAFFQKYFSAAKETKHLFQPESKEVLYGLLIENVGQVKEKVILFGANHNRNRNNYGNSKNIIVSSLFGLGEIYKSIEITNKELYGMMLADTEKSPIFIKKIRVDSENIDDVNFIDSLNISRIEIMPTGRQSLEPILFNPYTDVQRENNLFTY
jgi:hypothetical protein